MYIYIYIYIYIHMGRSINPGVYLRPLWAVHVSGVYFESVFTIKVTDDSSKYTPPMLENWMRMWILSIKVTDDSSKYTPRVQISKHPFANVLIPEQLWAMTLVEFHCFLFQFEGFEYCDASICWYLCIVIDMFTTLLI